MPSNHAILIRVTKNQHERIKNNAHARGYRTVSAYIRSLTLEHALHFEVKFDRLYQMLIKDEGRKESAQNQFTHLSV